MANVQTYKTLQDKVLAWLDEAGDTATTLTLVKYALNTANSKRVTQERWPFLLWPQTLTINTVVGQTHYSLHQEYLKPLEFRNQTTDRPLHQVTDSTEARARTCEGSATEFTLFSRTPVAAQPAAASVLSLSSSDPTDNGTASVTVTGDTATGTQTETITCGGSGAVLFTLITKVTKSSGWVGTLTLMAGATTLLSLLPAEFGRSYQQFTLLNTPTDAEVLEYSFYRQPMAMTLDNDLPDVPTPFEDLLVFDTLLSFASYNQYDAGTVKLWQIQRDEILLALQQTADATALHALTDYTSYVER